MTSPRPRGLLALASAGVALAAADTYVVVLALPDMMAGVGLGIESLQRATPIVSGFLLGYIAVLPLIGRLSDLVSRRQVLILCLALFVLGSVVTALAVELPVLVGGRVLQGVGGGGLVPATLALVADLWAPDRRGTPLGVVGAVQELGSVLGPLLGALVLAVADWRAIFWLNAVVAALLAVAISASVRTGSRPRPRALLVGSVAAVLCALTLTAPDALTSDVELGLPFVPFSGSSRVLTPIGLATAVALLALAAVTAHAWLPVLRRVDLVGALCVAVALGCLVLTFASADPAREVVGRWSSVLLPVGLLAAAAYLWRHRSAQEPLLPRGLMRGRVPASLAVSLLAGVALVAVVVDVPLLARITVTDSQTEAALVLVRFLLAVPVGAVVGGRLLRLAAPGAVCAPGLLLAGTGMALMSGWGQGSLDRAVPTTVVLVAVGFGVGLAIAPVNAAALADGPATAHGAVSAGVVVARMVGMVVGLAALTAYGLHRYYASVAALADQTDTEALAALAVVQVQTVFAGGAVAALAAAAVSLLLGMRPVRRPLADDPGSGRAPAGVAS